VLSIFATNESKSVLFMSHLDDDEASGILNVCTVPLDTILKSVPVEPTSNVCVAQERPLRLFIFHGIHCGHCGQVAHCIPCIHCGHCGQVGQVGQAGHVGHCGQYEVSICTNLGISNSTI